MGSYPLWKYIESLRQTLRALELSLYIVLIMMAHTFNQDYISVFAIENFAADILPESICSALPEGS